MESKGSKSVGYNGNRALTEYSKSQASNQRGDFMAQNHYVTKTKRRQKSGKRKDPSSATMAKLRQHAAADAKKAGK